ncbi:MAG: 6-phosphogluconate dehydrogenase [Cyclobacteriaceae bacterium]|nr:MAG: 6-phosphogluconate dehydrogenase [Cyclobacteriaceae bacterium]
MEQEGFVKKTVRSTVKWVKRLLLIALVLGLGVLAFAYYGVYEKGTMAGKVLRITEKGVLFKTYEGKISLESFGALKGVSPVAETFDFSIEGDQTEVIKQLEEVALSGERVNLHFVKRYVRFPWRGETKYFVEKVERASSN